MNDAANTEVKRGPGRPPKSETQAPEASPPRARPNRKPYGGTRMKMSYPPREGYHRHWANDDGSRIQELLDDGYTHVKDKDGNHVCKTVGTAKSGGGLKAYLLEIPQEWWDEKQAEKHRDVREAEELIKSGRLNEKPGDHRYIPAQGISVRTGR